MIVEYAFAIYTHFIIIVQSLMQRGKETTSSCDYHRTPIIVASSMMQIVKYSTNEKNKLCYKLICNIMSPTLSTYHIMLSLFVTSSTTTTECLRVNGLVAVSKLLLMRSVVMPRGEEDLTSSFTDEDPFLTGA